MVPSGFADLHHELYWWLRDRSTETEMRDTVRRLAAVYQVDVRRSVSISIGHAPRADRYDCCVQSPLQARATARHLRFYVPTSLPDRRRFTRHRQRTCCWANGTA